MEWHRGGHPATVPSGCGGTVPDSPEEGHETDQSLKKATPPLAAARGRPVPRRPGLGRSTTCWNAAPAFDFGQSLDVEIDLIWSLPRTPHTPHDQSTTAVRFVPGSHRWANHRVPRPEDVLEWHASESGDEASLEAIIILGGTMHEQLGSSSSSSTGGGTAFLRAGYHASFLRQRQNLYLRFPPQVASVGLPLHISRLIGYSMPGPVS